MEISPKLTEQTIQIFESRTGKGISQEEARQAVENICGFFRVLQEWAEAEAREGFGSDPSHPASMGGGL